MDGIGNAFYDSSDPPGDNGFPILPNGVTITPTGTFTTVKDKDGQTYLKFDGSTNYISLTDVDFLIFHQANLNMIEYVVRKLGFDMSRTYTNVQEIGNTGSASVGIALSECVSKGLIKDGQIVVMAAVGAGFNFGASVW